MSKIQLILLTLCLGVGSFIPLGAQESTALVDRPLTFRFQNQQVDAVLRTLAEQLDIHILYRENELPENPVSGTYENTPLGTILREVLGNSPLDFSVYRDYAIVIAPRSVIREMYTADYYAALQQNMQQAEEETAARERERDRLTVGTLDGLGPSGRAAVTVTVLDRRDDEPIIGATVRWLTEERGDASDVNGQFTFRAAPGEYPILLEYIGYQPRQVTLVVQGDGEVTVEMRSQATNLQEVLVTEEAPDDNVADTRASITKLDIKSLQKLPTVMGEADVLKGLLLYAGVSTTGEGAAGFNVRGGQVDQNLILQDEIFVFNSSHALGFYSTFNPDLISTVELYKGIIPAKFGGRLASVLDIQTRDGDFEQYRIKGSVSPITARLSVEGPLIKEKTSFIVGARYSYANWLLRLAKLPEVNRSTAAFNDINFKLTHKLSDRNTLSLSGATAGDEFSYNEEFGFNYRTTSGELTWRTIFTDKLFNKFSAVYSSYNSEQSDRQGSTAAILRSRIDYVKVKEQLTLVSNDDLRWDVGLSSILYMTEPGERLPFSENSFQVIPRRIEDENGLESAAFLQAEWSPRVDLTIMGGLRLSTYQYLGGNTVFTYENPARPVTAEIIDTVRFENGKVIDSYFNLEPRLSLRYRIDADRSIKGGYSRTVQYINQIFNSDSPTPTSQFQLSTNYIPPQKSHNFSIGYFQNLADNKVETSVELYYRSIDALYDYKDFAELNVNEHLETELLTGIGRSYGLELSLEKKEGLFNGRVSYTHSRAERQVVGINEANWYPSNFDRPHDLTFILNYQPNKRNTFTFNFTYGTGRPITVPLGTYRVDGVLLVPIYSDRNEFRIPDYHRLDIAYTLGQGYNRKKKFKTSWTLSVYNVYGRRNPYSVYFRQSPTSITKGTQLSLLGAAFPAITFNFSTI